MLCQVLQAWMADVQEVRQVQQQRAGVQQVIIGIAATHRRLQAQAQHIADAAVQAAAGVVAEAATASARKRPRLA